MDEPKKRIEFDVELSELQEQLDSLALAISSIAAMQDETILDSKDFQNLTILMKKLIILKAQL